MDVGHLLLGLAYGLGMAVLVLDLIATNINVGVPRQPISRTGAAINTAVIAILLFLLVYGMATLKL